MTREYQEEIKLREGLLVAFFGGLVVLGGPQRWWLEPILTRLDTLPLYLGGIALTAITDNAALTYLGTGPIARRGITLRPSGGRCHRWWTHCDRECAKSGRLRHS